MPCFNQSINMEPFSSLLWRFRHKILDINKKTRLLSAIMLSISLTKHNYVISYYLFALDSKFLRQTVRSVDLFIGKTSRFPSFIWQNIRCSYFHVTDSLASANDHSFVMLFCCCCHLRWRYAIETIKLQFDTS